MRYIMMAFESFRMDGTCTVGLKIDERRNRYEIGVDFFYDPLNADVWGSMSGFSQSADNAENLVYVHPGWQS